MKADTDKPVELSKTASSNITCDEKVTSHKENQENIEGFYKENK